MSVVVTLLTDFGLRDPYVGIMKAVIVARAPQARLIDLTHEIEPQNIRQGAFALASAVGYCPNGTVHLAVVDPGVGTERAAVVVQTHRGRYVAPDNGLLTLALRVDPPVGAWRLTREQFFLPQVSATFHGRDVFAPVAAHLANGCAPQDMGEEMDPASLVTFRVDPPVVSGGEARGAVLYVDRFGNLITNVRMSDVAGVVAGVRVGEATAPLVGAYQAVEPGAYLAVWGSSGYLEVSRNMGSASGSLGVGEGQRVDVLLAEGSVP